MSVSSLTKKRKHNENGHLPNGPTAKKAKKGTDGIVKLDKKGKGRANDDTQDEKRSAFRVLSTSVVLSIPPVFAMDPMKGVCEMLDSLVMKYVDQTFYCVGKVCLLLSPAPQDMSPRCEGSCLPILTCGLSLERQMS